MNNKGITDAVIRVLTDEPLARDDDHILWLHVVNSIHPGVKDMTFEEVLRKHAMLGVPSFESVSRARRKVQEDDVTLSSTKRIYEARKELEEEYRREYSS